LDLNELVLQGTQNVIELATQTVELATLTTLVLKDKDVDIARFIANQEEILQDARRGKLSSNNRELIRAVKNKLKKCLSDINEIEKLIG
jgi:hypothetical protein